MRYFERGASEVLLSDGNEGLKWVREREFAESLWLVDRWHIARNVRTLVGEDQQEHRRIMTAVWKSDSEEVLEALRTSPYRHTRPLEFNVLFGYILDNRDGIAESSKRISKCALPGATNVRAAAGVTTALNTWCNYSGSKLIRLIGPAGGAKPL